MGKWEEKKNQELYSRIFFQRCVQETINIPDKCGSIIRASCNPAYITTKWYTGPVTAYFEIVIAI